MTTIRHAGTAGLLFVMLVLHASTAGAADPAAKCEAAKLKTTNAYSSCRLKADAVVATKGGVADYTKCTDKFAVKFPASETKAGAGICPSEGDVAQVKAFVDACDDAIADQLSGGSLPLDVATCNTNLASCDGNLATCDTALTTCLAGCQCGNGVVDPGESCDGADVGGRTCANYGAIDSPGLGCTRACSFDFTGCSMPATLPARYVDNGDQTATDLWTGLVWELKTGTPGAFVTCPDLATCPDVHHVNNSYRWTADVGGTAFDGSAKTAFLDVLNDVAGNGTNCFAGHCDWRLPTVMELKHILLEPEAVGTCSTAPAPCIDPAFPGAVGNGGVWSATTLSDTPTNAYWVRFDFGGGVLTSVKISNRYVRAVRGGL
jgi:hypothetical protein